MKRFSLRLEDDLHEKLRRESFETGESINEIITKLIKSKYKEDIEMKKELLKKIDRIIEKEYWGMGHMGTEVISFTLELTDEEKEAFHEIELEENYGYDLDGNNLTISYSEEIE